MSREYPVHLSKIFFVGKVYWESEFWMCIHRVVENKVIESWDKEKIGKKRQKFMW